MGGSEHPGILYFYSESIGFGVNGVCAFIAALTNLSVGERDVSTAVLFIIIGGVMQLLCKFCMITLCTCSLLQYICIDIDIPAIPTKFGVVVFIAIHLSLQHVSYHMLISLSPKLHTHTLNFRFTTSIPCI